MKYINILLLLLLPFIIRAQIGIGQWRDHFAYSHIYHISINPTSVLAYTEQAMFGYDKSEKSINKYSKINGLSDFDIIDAHYSAKHKLTVLVYADANIDLLYDDGSIYNISDIHQKIELISPQVNRVLINNDYAYLSCSFGIVVLDLNKREIKNTYFIGNKGEQINILNLYLSADSIYALTDSVMKVAPLNYPYLEDFSVWKNKSLPFAYDKINEISGNNNQLAICTQFRDSTQIYLYKGNWQKKYETKDEIRAFYNYNNEYYIIGQKQIEIADLNLNINKKIDNYGFGDVNPHYCLKEGSNIYIADDYLGLVAYENNSFKAIYPNAPQYSAAYSIASKGDYLYVAGGGLDLAWNNRFNKIELFSFYDETWNSTILWQEKASDLISLAIDPYDNKRVYGGTWSNGVYVFYDGKLEKNYNQDNSPLQNIAPFTQNYIRIGSLTFDDFHNLWITNSSVSAPLKVLKNDGKWKSFEIGNQIQAPTLSKMIIDDYNQKWIVLARGHGLLVYNDNYTIDNESDDTYRQLSLINENGNLITNGVNDIALDKDGVIWLGTDKGVVSYFNPGGFKNNDNFYASQVRVFEQENDTVVQYLLETQNVTAVAVDGANRKWLGTESGGVFLVSADGQQTIVSFNTDNSPLISNHIKDIEINDNSGEIFFATDKGLISYRGSATTGHDEYFDVYVFPNPVRPDYSGDITITGLVSDVELKITDITGHLVNQTKALGGQAIWNGKNFSSNRVATGVYLVFSSNPNGSKTYVTKILFVN